MNNKLSRVEIVKFMNASVLQPTYLGLGTIVRTNMPEPQIRWDLITGSSPNPYAGLDRFGRVIDNKWTNYNTSATLDQIKYGYDRASNRVWRENVVSKALGTPKYFDELYGYDGSNRLSLMERGQLAGSPPSSVTNKQFAQDWGLDPTGNWKVFKENANGGGSWTLDQTRTSNTVNEITAINETAGPAWVTPGYDAAGNMTTIPRPAEPTGQFTGVYDAWNRLVALKGLGNTIVGRYEYDGLTRRVVKHTFPGWEELNAADWNAMTLEDWNGLQLTQAHRRDYYYNSSWQILEERVENSTAFNRQYVWGLQYIDGLVFRDRQLASSVERLYALQDANWNVTALVNTSGAIVERYSYTAYGMPTFLNPDFTPAANNEAYDWDVLYAGYKWDSESALYQVRFRYLQPFLGGWVSRDPIGYQRTKFSLYSYCSNNALIYVDAFGLKEMQIWAFSGVKPSVIGGDESDYVGFLVNELISKIIKSPENRGKVFRFGSDVDITTVVGDKVTGLVKDKTIKDRLNEEANNIATNDLSKLPAKHSDACKHPNKPVRIRLWMIAPKSHTEWMDFSKCCCHKPETSVIFDPNDPVSNQDIFEEPGWSMNAQLNFWSKWGNAYAVDIEAGKWDIKAKGIEFYKHSFSNYWNYDNPLDAKLEDGKRVKHNKPLNAMLTEVGNSILKNEEYDHLMICHSQGCNIAISVIHQMCKNKP